MEKEKDNEGNDNERELNLIGNVRKCVVSSVSPVFNILFAFGNKVFQYEIQSKTSFKQVCVIDYSDEILSLDVINDDIIVAGKQNKSISRLSSTSEVKAAYFHNKKLSSMLVLKEEEEFYLLFSDKFGEIHLKLLSDSKEEFAQKGKILFGHCDPVTFLQLSPQKKLLLSSDSFGKIKVYQFPNCFNVLTVILYRNDEIKYVNFISEEAFIALTNENELHLWSTFDFTLNEKLKVNDTVTSIGVLGINLFYIETKTMIHCYNIDSINRKFTIKSAYSKPQAKDAMITETEVFMFNNTVLYASFKASDHSLISLDIIT